MATKLEGAHTKAVLCVTTSHGPESRIISGGEDGELVVWTPDMSGYQRVQIFEEGTVCSLVCSKTHPNILYASCDTRIVKLDMNNPDQILECYEFNDDEVYQMALNDKEEYLAAADDSGATRIIDLSTKKLFKTLRKHSNICSGVVFRPSRPWDAITVGYDSHLMQWDFSRGRNYCCINLEDFSQPPDDADSFIVSPAFVHSLAMSQDGSIVACGTENGLVHLFNASKKVLAHSRTLYAHSAGVCQVHFPIFQDDLLISAGNDSRILFWKLDADAVKPRLTNGNSEGHSPPSAPAQLVPQCAIEHVCKINWLSTGISPSQQKFVVVADNSSTVTVYPFPL